MSACIIEFADIRARLAARCRAAVHSPLSEPAAARFHFWTGASGKRYVHTIYTLDECPALQPGNVIFVARDEQGRRSALSIGRVTHPMGPVNLAEIRYRGRSLGANEVHVHLLAATVLESKRIEFDLRAGQLNGGAASDAGSGDEGESSHAL